MREIGWQSGTHLLQYTLSTISSPAYPRLDWLVLNSMIAPFDADYVVTSGAVIAESVLRTTVFPQNRSIEYDE